MVRTFLKVYMELCSSFLFLQEQIKDIIIRSAAVVCGGGHCKQRVPPRGACGRQAHCAAAASPRVDTCRSVAAARHGSLHRHWGCLILVTCGVPWFLGPFWKPWLREEMRTVHGAFCVNTPNPNSHPMTQPGDTWGDVLTYLQPLPWTFGRAKAKKPWLGHGSGRQKPTHSIDDVTVSPRFRGAKCHPIPILEGACKEGATTLQPGCGEYRCKKKMW